MKTREFLLSLTAALAPVIAHADSTIAQPITRVPYNGNADYAYFVGAAGWGANGCNSYYVQITNGVPGRDKLLAIALAAHAAGKRVQFEGSCDSSPSYFDAYYIIVTD
jgi:hypothetical protein